MFILAHAGDTHQSQLAATAHSIAWYVQLPLFAMIVCVASMVWLLTKKIDTTLLVTSFGMLVAGFGLIQLSPLISIVSITAGLITTLGVTLLGLGAGGSQ